MGVDRSEALRARGSVVPFATWTSDHLLRGTEIGRYLVQRGLIDAESIVAGDVSITDASRRHRNFIVRWQDGHGYFTKQATDHERSNALRREALAYEILNSTEPTSRSSLTCVPRLWDYDQERSVLVVELVPDAEDLRTAFVRRRRFSSRVARLVGRALAILHALPTERWRRTGGPLLSGPHWVLSIHEPHVALLRDISAANISLIRTIQASEALVVELSKLRDSWLSTSLIHQDLRWDNVIVATKTATYTSDVRIIDWEAVALGDPAWDVASVLADYLALWVQSIPLQGETTLEEMVALSQYPLAKMHPAMASFWSAYLEYMAPMTRTSEFVWRVVRYVAARLIQTAVEQLQSSADLTGSGPALLQLSINVLQRPQEAAFHLLCVPTKVNA